MAQTKSRPIFKLGNRFPRYDGENLLHRRHIFVGHVLPFIISLAASWAVLVSLTYSRCQVIFVAFKVFWHCFATSAELQSPETLHRITQSILSWKAPTRIIESNPSANGPNRDWTHLQCPAVLVPWYNSSLMELSWALWGVFRAEFLRALTQRWLAFAVVKCCSLSHRMMLNKFQKKKKKVTFILLLPFLSYSGQGTCHLWYSNCTNLHKDLSASCCNKTLVVVLPFQVNTASHLACIPVTSYWF